MINSSGTNLDGEAGRSVADSRDGVRNLTRINKTGEPQVIPASDGRLAISVPIQIKRRSGRKLVALPTGETATLGLGTASRRPCNWRWPADTAGSPCWSRAR